ncbi:MAG: SGNH/GDSL hydrolase family protein [Synechococcaceae cyanobacterium]
MRAPAVQGRDKARLIVPLLLAFLGWGFSSQPAAAKLRNLSKLAVIGDSYSDGGTSGLRTQSAFYPGSPGFPFPYYANGRFTNGPVAVEQLWSLFNPALPPLKPSISPGGTNYAFGGATSGSESYLQIAPDMPGSLKPLYANTSAHNQLAGVLGSFTPGSFDASSTLFTFWMGPNDALYWLNTKPMGSADGLTPGSINGDPPVQTNAEDMLKNSMSNIAIGIQRLINNGAQQVLVPNLLDFSKAPAFSGDHVQAATVKALVLGFNQGLVQTLNQLRLANQDVEIMDFDTAALFDRIFANPGSYGFSNIDQPCTSIYASTTFTSGCSPTADNWLFWDGVHVTTAAHSVIAAEMFNTVYEVPGPLPAAGGVVAFGWARRLRCRHRKVVAPQAAKPALD